MGVFYSYYIKHPRLPFHSRLWSALLGSTFIEMYCQCLLVDRSNSHLWLLTQCKQSGVLNQSHMHTHVAMALYNVVCSQSHMTSDITDGHMLYYQSLLIQTGWCKINNTSVIIYLECSADYSDSNFKFKAF